VSFCVDTATSRIGSGPANLATIRAAIIAAVNDAGYMHVPEGRRTTQRPAKPPPPRPRLGQMGTLRNTLEPWGHRGHSSGGRGRC
jgi:hypothetical protein